MVTNETREATKTAKVGWGILVIVSALVMLGGVVWFFAGPESSVSWLEEDEGVPLTAFTEEYPVLAEHNTRSTRQVAIWITSFGLVSVIVAVEGLRSGRRWAWYATWVVVGAPIAVGINYLPSAELGFDNVGNLLIGAVALVGQLLASTGLGPMAEEKV